MEKWVKKMHTWNELILSHKKMEFHHLQKIDGADGHCAKSNNPDIEI